MQILKEVKRLFITRDNSVAKQDKKMFLLTQIGEIEGGSSDGYLDLEKMETEVLYVHDETEIEKVVFVKETYYPKGGSSHSAFLAYFWPTRLKVGEFTKLDSLIIKYGT